VITLANAVYERVEGNIVAIDHVEEFLPDMNQGLVAFDQMLDQSQFAPIQFLYRARALEKTGLYREDLPVLGDWEFNLRFLRHFDIKVIPQILAFYHHRVEDAGGGYSNSIYGAREKHAFYRQMLKNEWLREDLREAEGAVRHLVDVPLSQGQFDALASFVFNVGPSAFGNSTLLRLLNGGDAAGAAEQFKRWNRGADGPLPGLVLRRAAERTLFLSREPA